MTRPRVCIGRDLALVAEDDEGVELEGERRLRPGHFVDVVREGPVLVVRGAIVASWQVVRLGSRGPRYRGYCRWS